MKGPKRKTLLIIFLSFVLALGFTIIGMEALERSQYGYTDLQALLSFVIIGLLVFPLVQYAFKRIK